MPVAETHEHHIATRRTARYFTLGAAESPREVWIVLHGHGQLAGTFIRYFSDLDDGRTLVVAPEALSRYYLVAVDAAPASERPVGATWMTRDDRQADIGDYIAYLDTLFTSLEAAWDPANRPTVRVVGFSQGAATAARWCALGSARVDQWILWGGLVPPDSDLAVLAKVLGDRSLTIVMGTRDQYTSPAALVGEQQRLTTRGVATNIITFEGGHAINRQALRQVAGR